MSFDAEAIAELFSAFGPVDVRRMFSGAGLYSDGVFFALAHQGLIYLKADEESAARFAAEGCTRFSYRARTRIVETNLWRMPERLYDDPAELAEWTRQALAAALRARSKKPRRGKTAAVSRNRRHSGTRRKARARTP
jgi:DNA transformation protein